MEYEDRQGRRLRRYGRFTPGRVKGQPDTHLEGLMAKDAAKLVKSWQQLADKYGTGERFNLPLINSEKLK